MGEEIQKSRFDESEFKEFEVRLRAETKLLSSWFQQGRFSSKVPRAGFELEAWLVNPDATPAPLNDQFLNHINDPLVVPELASFNIEVNSNPRKLSGDVFTQMHEELSTTWAKCRASAESLGARLAMIGILPTAQEGMLTIENMSSMRRYKALNEQVFRLRKGKPIEISIDGVDHLRSVHNDVMLESAATSFQLHLKVKMEQAAQFYNLSKIISAPMVAMSANSPYLFDCDLWDETRIPLFEQAVSVVKADYSKRVSFGIRYADKSLMECFDANVKRYPVMLPTLFDSPLEELAHLRMHNGTVWRWTRPLIGFDGDGSPHLRIEHRVVPAGPTVIDTIANAAFFFGLMYGLIDRADELIAEVPFLTAKENFYRCAQHGLNAEVEWPLHQKQSAKTLLLDQLLPLAHKGLHALQVDAAEINQYLGIIEARAMTGRNGAYWQRQWVACNGKDMTGLVLAYMENQEAGRPVHEWDKSC